MRRIVLTLFVLAGAVCPANLVAQNGDQIPVMLGVRFVENSAVISYVKPNGPAERAGLLAGDELHTVDADYILQPGDLRRALDGKKPGDPVTVEALRDGEFRFFEVSVMRTTRHDERIAADGRILPPLPPWGMVYKPLPEPRVAGWHGLPEGQSTFSFSEYRGKVVALMLFQVACPYSHQDGLPLMKRLHDRYGNDSDVKCVAIQSFFEPDDRNTLANAAMMFADHDLPIPVGQDQPEGNALPILKRLKALGTPWIILVDREGIVQHNGTPDTITSFDMIEQLKRGELDSPTAPPLEYETDAPASRGGVADQ